MRNLADRLIVACSLVSLLGCTSSSAGGSGAAGGSGGAGGISVGTGGSSGTGGSGGTGGTGGTPGAVDAGSDARTPSDAGSPSDGSGDAGGGFVCNQVTAMTLTAEWYNAGFENGVANARWQLKAMEHGYITEWANPNSTFWATPITSACAQQSSSPDRIVLTVLSWTITTQSDWETQIDAAIANLQAKYPAVRRIDLLTVIRGPHNMTCPTPPAAGETIAMPPALDAAIAAAAARAPGLVFAGPKFEAPDCAAFNGGGPHLTTAGNTAMAKMISSYFAATQ
jgi:hypothetical protein